MSKRRKFVIDRRTWLRGVGNNASVLRNRRGMMCCLGHIALQCGLKEDQIRLLGTPYALGERHQRYWPEPLRANLGELPSNSILAVAAMDRNDDELLDDNERERALISLFADYGIDLEFIN